MNSFKNDKIIELICGVLDNMALRLYDIQFNEVSKTLRVFIDRKNGSITVDDCKKVSTLISGKLNGSEYIVSSYALEVSSPGIERRLSRPEHYVWAIGNLVEIDSRDKKTRGYIRDVKKDGVVIATDTGEVMFAYTSIVRAKIVEELLHDKHR